MHPDLPIAMAESRSVPRAPMLLRLGRYPAALLLIAAAAAGGWILQPGVPGAGIVMLFLLAAVVAGLYLGRGPAILTAIVGSLVFNFLFTQPRFTLHIADVAEILTFVALLTVGLVIAQLASRARMQAQLAQMRERHALALARFTEALLGLRDEVRIVATGCRHIREALDAASCVLLQIDASGPAPCAGSPGPNSLDIRAARTAAEAGGAISLRADSDPFVHTQVLVADAPQRLVLVVQWHLSETLSEDELRSALADFARQFALALERARLLRKTEEAELAVRAEDIRASLLSGLSHDLRTPLASILGSASALLEKDAERLQPVVRELLLTIQDESLRMTRLVSNLLEMARLTQGIRLRREWIPLDELIGSARNRLADSLRKRTVTVRLADDLPLLHVEGLLIEQLLQNLLENAVKYSPQGSPIEITADLTRTEQASVRVCVMDRGPGIPQVMHEAVFEKFVRLDPEGAQSGVGLGLALCRSIVELHGGRIGVADREGGGAVLWFTVPADEVVAGPGEDLK